MYFWFVLNLLLHLLPPLVSVCLTSLRPLFYQAQANRKKKVFVFNVWFIKLPAHVVDINKKKSAAWKYLLYTPQMKFE